MKEIKVILIGKAKENYLNIEGSSSQSKLFSSIRKKVDLLKKDVEAGIQIRRNQIPGYYSKQYCVTNLWKMNLQDGWRVIYTIKTDEKATEVILLDIFSHKDYERRFGY